MIKKIILFFVFTLNVSIAAAQISSVQQTPFGDVELLSCTTALRKDNPVYLGVAVEPNEGWQLDEPNFNIYTSDNSPATLLTPFEQPYSPQKIYPITAQPSYKTGHPVTFTVRGFWRACKENVCITEPIRLARTLDAELAFMTPECTGITFGLSNTPTPMHKHLIHSQAIVHSDGIHVILDFKHEPKILQLYDAQRQLLNIPTTINGRRVTFILPHTSDAKLHFFVRTHLRYYEIELPTLPQNTPSLPLPISALQIIWAAFMFFLTSAAPIFWARLTTKSKSDFHAQTRQMMRLTLSTGVVMLGLLCAYGPFDLTYYPLSKAGTLIAMGLGLLLVPASPLLVSLFVFLTPKPYFDVFANTSLVTQVCLFMTCILITWSAFALQLLNEQKILKLFKQKGKISAIWWIARLPWIALMLYTFFYL